MTKRVYTVIETSGWMGAGWEYVDEFETRKEAEAKAAEIHQTDAKERGYIVAVVGDNHTCDVHDGCCIADTSRVKTDRHLRNRRQHIQFER